MSRALPFTQKALERAISAVEKKGYKPFGIKPDGTVLFYSGDERPAELSTEQPKRGSSWDDA